MTEIESSAYDSEEIDEKYFGKYIAIIGKKIVAVSENPGKAVKEAREKHNRGVKNVL